jgi:hypothetical protein
MACGAPDVIVIVLALACHVPLASGCSGAGDPCFGVARGDQFTIRIIAPNDAQSGFVPAMALPMDCQLGFDLAIDQVLMATVVSRSNGATGGCTSSIPTYTGLGDWSWTLRQTDSERAGGPGRLLEGIYGATRGTCAGSLVASVAFDGTFEPPEPGRAAHAYLERVFTRTSAAGDPQCPASCSGSFVVSVARP